MPVNFFKQIYSIFLLVILIVVTNFAQNSQEFEIKKIEFSGNNSFSANILRNVILSKESPGKFMQFLHKFTDFGGEAEFFNPTGLESDLVKLKNFYADNGFFKTNIKLVHKIDSSDYSVESEFIIEEKAQSTINSFELKGLERIYPDFLGMIQERLTLEKGIKFSANLVRQNRQIVVDFLSDRGYMFINYDKPVITVDTTLNQVDISLRFYPGKRYIISDVIVERKTGSKDDVSDELISDIVNIKAGDFFSNFEVQKAQIRLYRTNLFNSITVNPLKIDTAGNYVPLIINAEIGKMYQISPELIFNYDKETNKDRMNYGISTEFSKRNFLGNARKLTMGVSIAAVDPFNMLRELSFTNDKLDGTFDTRLAIEQPDFFGLEANTKIESYFTLQKYGNIYNSRLLGIKLNFDFELPKYTYVTAFNTRFTWENSTFIYDQNNLDTSLVDYFMGTFNKDKNDSKKILDELKQQKKINNKFSGNNSVLGFDIAMNHTNDPILIFPTEGYNINLTLEDGNFFPLILKKAFNFQYSATSYYKVQISSSVYSGLFDMQQSAFAAKLKVGYMQSYSGDRFKIPINERFTAGGSNSVRAWKSRELTPAKNMTTIEELNLSDLSNSDLDALINKRLSPGGFILLEGSVEARMHLFGDIGSAIFLDFGNTWNNFNEIAWNRIAVGVGFGVRYYTPFAPLRFDFGFKLYGPDSRSDYKYKSLNSFMGNFEFQIGIGEAF